MPRLNSLGEAVMGIGGLQTSVDGSVPTALIGVDGGDWDWLDDTTIVGKADTGGGYEIYTLLLPGGSLVQVGDGESTYLWAGGGAWTAYAAAFPGIQSNVTALDIPHLPMAGVGDVAEDGWSALITNFASDSNISVYDETGVLMNQVSVTVFPENGTVRLRGDVLSYADAQRSWKLRDRDTNAVLPFAERTSIQTVLVPVTVGGSIYVLERDAVEPAEMLTMRMATAAQGYVITNAGIVYNPDVVHLTGNVVRVAYSTGQGELPDELVMHDINLLSGAHSMATIVAGAPVWVAQPNLTTTPLPASAVPGTSSILNEGLYRQTFVDKNGLINRPWLLALQALGRAAGGPVNLSNVTGVLDQDNGGTGTTDGVTDVAVSVDPTGALDGNGQTAAPLAVRVDGVTITVNGDNELEAASGGGGTVTNTGTLTANALIVGNAGVDVKALASLGTTTTLLHGNAAGLPTFGAVSLTADVSGDLPFANLAQGAALSVLGVTGNATADVASIAAGTDHQVLRRSGTAVAFGAVNLAQSAAVTGILPVANGGTGSASGAALLKSTTVLTDAQIKALPSTPIQLIAAPGASFRTVVVKIDLWLNASGGDYTNVNTNDAYIVASYGSMDWSTYLFNDTASPASTALTDFLSGVGTFGTTRQVTLTELFGPFSAAQLDLEWGNTMPFVIGGGSLSNQAVNIAADNNGSGNWTGGNAANTLTVRVLYTVEPVP